MKYEIGWAECGRVVEKLIQEAKQLGVTVIQGYMSELIYSQYFKG